MSKKEFIKRYNSLSKEDRAEIKAHWLNLFNNPMFIDTFEIAEQRLLWIREAESND